MYNIKNGMCFNHSKIQAWCLGKHTFAVWASGMEWPAKGNKIMWWNQSFHAKLQDFPICQIC